MSDSQPTVAFFKKGKSRPANNRKRSPSPPDPGQRLPTSTAGPSVILPSRKQGGNLLSAGTKRTASQRDGLDDGPEREGLEVKWTASGSHQQVAQDILAGDEAEEMMAKRAKKSVLDGDELEQHPADGLYHGQTAYKSHLKKSQEVPKAMRVGPQKGTSTIRTVTMIDYQPDVCKDYKGSSARP